jgi:hypothetical protein
MPADDVRGPRLGLIELIENSFQPPPTCRKARHRQPGRYQTSTDTAGTQLPASCATDFPAGVKGE